MSSLGAWLFVLSISDPLRKAPAKGADVEFRMFHIARLLHIACKTPGQERPFADAENIRQVGQGGDVGESVSRLLLGDGFGLDSQPVRHLFLRHAFRCS